MDNYDTSFFENILNLLAESQNQQVPEPDNQDVIGESNDNSDYEYLYNEFNSLKDKYDELESMVNKPNYNFGSYEGYDQFLNFLFNSDDKMPLTFKDDQNLDLSKSIADRESKGSGSYKAFNPAGGGEGAVGKYQFRWNLHKDKISKLTGISDKQEFLNSPEAQEAYYKDWESSTLLPTAKKLLPYAQKSNPNITVEEVARQVHFSGPKGAEDFYKKGKVTRDALGMTNYTYQNGGDVSSLGYSKKSPYKNSKYLIIDSPEGDITMKDTEFPLIGVDNTGDSKLMLPGNDYKFKGNKVLELPLMQNGGRSPIFTNNPNDPRLKAYNDSLKTFNLANLEQKNYYNGKSGVPVPFSKNPQFNSANEFIDSHYGEYTGNSYNRAKELNTVAKRARIKPYGQYTPPPNTGGIGDQYPAYFKKPVQPVVYQAPSRVEYKGSTYDKLKNPIGFAGIAYKKVDLSLKKKVDNMDLLRGNEEQNPQLRGVPQGNVELGKVPTLPYRVEYDGTKHQNFMTAEEGEKFMQELQNRPQGIPYGVRGYYEKKQNGGATNSGKNKYQDFYNKYITSDEYKNRLLNFGYNKESLDNIIKVRTNSINHTNIEETEGRSNSKNPNLIQYNLSEGDPDEIISHEYSHKAGSGAPELEGLTLNDNEIKILNTLNKVGYTRDKHLKNPYEAKADIDSFRFLMNQELDKDPATPYNEEDINASEKNDKINNSTVNKRLKKRYKKEDLIKLLNSIASNSNNQNLNT